MNIPAASLIGGIWERQIRSVRAVLNALITPAATQLNDEAFRTLMCEVMAIINSRPLTVDNLNDAKSPIPLSPNNLLTMKSGVILPPPGNFQREDIYLKKQWRRVQFLADQFWHRWKQEYIQNLQTRQRWVQPKRDCRVGDIVLVKDQNFARCDWPLARVIEVYPSDDHHVRKVKVIVADSNRNQKGIRTSQPTYLERPIQKLVVLLETPEFHLE